MLNPDLIETASALIGAGTFFIVAIFQLMLVAGLPYGDMAYGGFFSKKLPWVMRIASFVAALVLVFLAAVFLAEGEFITTFLPDDFHSGAVIFATAYALINTFGNLASKSKKERFFATPLSLTIFVCGLILIVP